MEEVKATVPHGGAPGPACSQCGLVFSEDEMIRYGDAWICAACKPAFFQRLKEGVATTGTHVYAGFWIRLVAKIIDWIIIAVPNFIVTFVMGILMGSAGSKADFSVAAVVMSLVQLLLQMALPIAYETWFVGKYSATPGKMACGIKIIMPDGGPVSYWRAFGRCFAEWVSGIVLGIGYLMAGFDAEKRSLHDRMCNTRVVKK